MDMTFGIGQAIGGIGQYFGQRAAAKQSEKNLKAQMQHERSLAEYRYSKDLEMWEKANFYNEPSQQMARLREAGLNPALMYGKATGANQAATQLPKYNQAAADHSQRKSPMVALSVLSMFQDLALKQAQVDNVRKQNESVQLNNGITALNKKMKEFEVDYKLSKIMRKTGGEGLDGEFTVRPYLSWLYDSQLESVIEQNRLKQQSLLKSKQDTFGSYQTNQLRKFELDAWKELGKAGQIGKFSLPFLKLLLGR